MYPSNQSYYISVDRHLRRDWFSSKNKDIQSFDALIGLRWVIEQRNAAVLKAMLTTNPELLDEAFYFASKNRLSNSEIMDIITSHPEFNHVMTSILPELKKELYTEVLNSGDKHFVSTLDKLGYHTVILSDPNSINDILINDNKKLMALWLTNGGDFFKKGKDEQSLYDKFLRRNKFPFYCFREVIERDPDAIEHISAKDLLILAKNGFSTLFFDYIKNRQNKGVPEQVVLLELATVFFDKELPALSRYPNCYNAVKFLLTRLEHIPTLPDEVRKEIIDSCLRNNDIETAEVLHRNGWISQARLDDYCRLKSNQNYCDDIAVRFALNLGANPEIVSKSQINRIFGSPTKAYLELSERSSPTLVEFLVKRHVENSKKSGPQLAKDKPDWLKPYYEKSVVAA